MVYRPRARSPRNSGRRREMPCHSSRRERARAKAKGQKRRSSGSYILEEKQVSTSEEVVNRTLTRLNILGSQRFALPPFNYHFDRWLMNLKSVLSDFESSPAIKADDQFVKECSQVLSDVELKLEESRLKEFSAEKAIRNLSDAKRLLEQTEDEYATKSKESENRRDHEVERLSSKAEAIREEIAHIARMKTGFFTGISRKVKAQKRLEATGRLTSAENELAETMKSFINEQERLRDEYVKRKQLILEQIRNHEKEIENLGVESQTDGSIEARRSACEALVKAVNALLRRSPLVTSN